MSESDIPTETLYETLGVTETATPEEIKRAYFRLVRQFRPEDHPEEFNRFTNARDVLGDPRQRKEYDLMRRYGEQINALIDQAMEVMEDDPALAVKLCKQAVVIAPELPMPRRLLASALMSAREFIQAETVMRRLIALFPEDTSLRFRLSQCLWLQDKNAEAGQEARQLLQLTPGDRSVYRLLSRIYRDLNEPLRAVEVLEQAIAIDDLGHSEDQEILLELLKLHAVQHNASETARTAQRILATVPPGDEDAANSAMASLYNLSIDFFTANAYQGAYEVLSCIQLSLVNDPTLLEDVQKAEKIMGAYTDALRMLDDDQISIPVKAYVYSQYFDNDDEVTEQQGETVVENIVGEIVQSPVASQAMFRYVVRSYQHFANHKSEFLHLLDGILNEELSGHAAAPAPAHSRVAVLQPPAPHTTPPPRPGIEPRSLAPLPSGSAGEKPSGGSCLLKVIGIIILIALLPLLLHLLVVALPVLIVGALIVGIIAYFIKKS